MQKDLTLEQLSQKLSEKESEKIAKVETIEIEIYTELSKKLRVQYELDLATLVKDTRGVMKLLMSELFEYQDKSLKVLELTHDQALLNQQLLKKYQIKSLKEIESWRVGEMSMMGKMRKKLLVLLIPLIMALSMVIGWLFHQPSEEDMNLKLKTKYFIEKQGNILILTPKIKRN